VNIYTKLDTKLEYADYILFLVSIEL